MIRLLDCTLRDGAHVNSGNFGYQKIKDIAMALTAASVDVVELGFLKNVSYNKDISFYPKIEDAYQMVPAAENESSVEYSLMARADDYDIRNLSECNGTIKYIRVAFYYDYLEGAIKFAKELRARGYEFTLNLINTPGCSAKELEKVVEYANDIKPYALTIVDTFGVLCTKELDALLSGYEHLDPGVTLGLHVHENLALSFSLAQHFIDRVGNNREIMIDGSLMGMGRIPGNLCIELIADYLNNTHGKQYDIAPIMRSIDEHIVQIKDAIPWGYSPAYFLSAKHRVHRSYSEYLLKKNISLDKMDVLLGQIDSKQALKFDKSYMEALIKRITESAN